MVLNNSAEAANAVITTVFKDCFFSNLLDLFPLLKNNIGILLNYGNNSLNLVLFNHKRNFPLFPLYNFNIFQIKITISLDNVTKLYNKRHFTAINGRKIVNILVFHYAIFPIHVGKLLYQRFY